MGTFIIRPTSIGAGWSPVTDDGSLPIDYAGWAEASHPPNTVLDALLDELGMLIIGANVINSTTSPQSFSQDSTVGAAGASIYLDGSGTPVDFDSLPAGFELLSASVKVDATVQQPGATGSSKFNLTGGNSEVGADNVATLVLDVSSPFRMFDLVFNGFGINVDITVLTFPDAASVAVNNLRIEGTYTLQQFKFSLDTESPVGTGDTVTITSPDLPDFMDLDDITDITVRYKTLDNVDHSIVIPASAFVTQGPHILRFIFPDVVNAPKADIEATGDGTQFSGSVPLGSLLTLFLTNASGLYKLVSGKTNDTLYLQDYTPVITGDTKIPNPFFKTGFLP